MRKNIKPLRELQRGKFHRAQTLFVAHVLVLEILACQILDFVRLDQSCLLYAYVKAKNLNLKILPWFRFLLMSQLRQQNLNVSFLLFLEQSRHVESSVQDVIY